MHLCLPSLMGLEEELTRYRLQAYWMSSLRILQSSQSARTENAWSQFRWSPWHWWQKAEILLDTTYFDQLSTSPVSSIYHCRCADFNYKTSEYPVRCDVTVRKASEEAERSPLWTVSVNWNWSNLGFNVLVGNVSTGDEVGISWSKQELMMVDTGLHVQL